MSFRRKAFNEPVDRNQSVEYYDLHVLKNYIMEGGRIVPSRITGVPAKFQRRVAHAIKVARFLALIPYCDTHK